MTLTFPTLPAEIRLAIWAKALLIPRVIDIRTEDYPANIALLKTRHDTKCSDIRWVTKCPPPSALSVCRESRQEALKVYSVRFELLASGPECIYINPRVDIIFPYIDKWTEMLEILTEDIRAFDPEGHGVRRLALMFGLLTANYSASFGRPSKKRVALMQRLAELIVVVGNMPEVWGVDYVLATPSMASEMLDWEGKGSDILECFENAARVEEGSSSGQIPPKESAGVKQILKLNILAFRRRDEAEGLTDGILHGPRRTWAELEESRNLQ